MKEKYVCIITYSAHSGAGKTTLLNVLFEKLPAVPNRRGFEGDVTTVGMPALQRFNIQE
jgi:ABC-type multidrug transport system ATPase subunit